MAKANALSSLFVKQCRKPGVYCDGQGLMLRVETAGTKRWVLRVTVRGKRRDIGLGSANSTPLVDVREKAFELRKLARAGRDPVQSRKQAVVPTFADAAFAVHRQRLKLWSNDKHSSQWINSLSDHAFPLIGEKLVSEITTADILKVLTPIWLTKSETARRIRQRIYVVLEWATVAGYRDGANPAAAVGAGLPRARNQGRHFAAMPYGEVPAFMTRLHAVGSAEASCLALQFLILTAARTGEVIGATWAEIDFENATWIISAERMKARLEHRVPLSPQSLAVLKKARTLQLAGNLIFPGRRGQRLSNMSMAMILRRRGRAETVHGFRSSFRDWSAESTNFPRDVCEAALAHVIRNKTERAYRRTDLFEKRRQLMNAWAGFLFDELNTSAEALNSEALTAVENKNVG